MDFDGIPTTPSVDENAPLNVSMRCRTPESDGYIDRPYGPGCVGSNYKKSYYNYMKKAKSERIINQDRALQRINSKGSGSMDDDDNVNVNTRLSYSDRGVSYNGSLRDPEPSFRDDSPIGDLATLKDMVITNPVNILLVFIPLAFVADYLSWPSQPVFWINFFAMIPLACVLGDLTEEIALHTNQTLGGLINATFGNAVEVVVAIQALCADEFRVVQASMIGSIYSNLLLVLGCSFFFGGVVHKEQSFNHMVATANMALLCLSSIAFVLPTPFAMVNEQGAELLMSRTVSIALMLMYVQLLVFQLKTHKEFFDDGNGGEKPELTLFGAGFSLCVVTILISKLSQFLVESIDGFCEESGMSRTFVGLIILPVVGNAVEHMTAVRSAINNKMDLAMGIAVGSSTQISLFVAPLTVIIGWKMGKPMTLNYPLYEIMLYVLSVLVVGICISYPRSNWLEGSILITTYGLVAIGFWYEKVDADA